MLTIFSWDSDSIENVWCIYWYIVFSFLLDFQMFTKVVSHFGDHIFLNLTIIPRETPSLDIGFL